MTLIAGAALPPLKIKKVFVIGIAKWKFDFTTLEDAAACIVGELERTMQEQDASLELIEVMLEFTSGESERCAYKDKRRVFEWMGRFGLKVEDWV